ncbi:hypothetical protein SK128_027371 [Halocaridina rubra]|uniref:Uncharacterized protein n=1 Tax=Halocaridina rubra TaxID=373956 RepID=A0AAN8XLE3_HALRR
MYSQRLALIALVVTELSHHSQQMSVRRRLISNTSKSTTAKPEVTQADTSSPTLFIQDGSTDIGREPILTDIQHLDQALHLLIKATNNQNHSLLEDDALVTGNVKVDELLSSLREPSDNSRTVWMALLNELVSDGSLNEMLGNILHDTTSDKRQGRNLLLDGQDQINEHIFGQLEGPSPETQMEEFILEPHLGPAIMPFDVPEGLFVSFIPRRAFGVVSGVSRPAHGHGSFYVHRPPGLVDIINPPAYGFLFNSYRRFQPDAQHHKDLHYNEEFTLEGHHL